VNIANEVLELRIQVLSKILTKTVQNDPELSGQIEPLLALLGKEDEKKLLLNFTRWLSSKDPKQTEFLANNTQREGAISLEKRFDQMLETVKTKSPTEEKMETRINMLSEMIKLLVTSDYEFSGNLEMLLEQLKNEPEKSLITSLTRWIFNQTAITLGLAGKGSGQSNATPLQYHLALLKEELLVGEAMAGGRIRSTYMGEIFGDMKKVLVPLSVIHQETQHMNHVDMVYVCAIPKIREAKSIFEIGTYRGQTTCGFADMCENAQVYTLNLPPQEDERYGEYIGSFIQTSPNKHRIHQLFSDSMKFDTTPYQNTMDFIFIDGDHSYEYVKNDTEKAFELLAPNGAIAWHDFAGKTEGVVKYLSELAIEKPLMRIKDTCLILYIENMNFDTFHWKSLQASLEEKEYG
jgi:tRNA A58 N-methylase Trm61